MSLGKTNFILSNINATLGSAVSAFEGKQKGDDWGTSLMNFGLNVMNGGIRNGVAYDIYKDTGSSLGFIINGTAGYGKPEANEKAMKGLFGASLLSSAMRNPWYNGGFYGGSLWGGGMYGSPFGGGMFGGYYGGGMMMPMMPMMPTSTSYTEVHINQSGCGHHRHFWC